MRSWDHGPSSRLKLRSNGPANNLSCIFSAGIFLLSGTAVPASIPAALLFPRGLLRLEFLSLNKTYYCSGHDDLPDALLSEP